VVVVYPQKAKLDPVFKLSDRKTEFALNRIPDKLGTKVSDDRCYVGVPVPDMHHKSFAVVSCFSLSTCPFARTELNLDYLQPVMWIRIRKYL
jgi:hypothetical protein